MIKLGTYRPLNKKVVQAAHAEWSPSYGCGIAGVELGFMGVSPFVPICSGTMFCKVLV